ncbi:MAG: putative metal-dependent hydrolase YabD [Anaerolineaceae bacterium]|nr:TatD family deoxyribonuclease [Anaerolineae bacterium]MDL1926701.1 TatD family deoxyribonuclease [Anaerolineae bacterium AMX1]WKZ49810.1 MAG: TatD family hydrolase [Anaerolineales bacterium]GIK09572.1 MAG: putative metal-dependent hydrolase YabD [Chloroflexota bacterium]GJQ38589.1 MAG: putative metal-dependent hydrolase YabD [Anaerolineaceae bacterium]
MRLADTHCHLNFRQFDADRASMLARAKAAGVERFLVPGLDHRSSADALQLAESDAAIYAAVGFHPTELEEFSEATFEQVRKLAAHPKAVAVGEIGLDHYWVKDEAQRARQRDALKRQLDFAAEIGKPAVIHMREENDAWFGSASVELLEILSEWRSRLVSENHPLAERPGVLHSFNGTLETAQKAVAMNFFIGVTGPVTYKNADQKRAVISQLPLARLLIETDSPFLAPVPQRGKRNEPAFVVEIADKIAEIKFKKMDEVAAVTADNAARLFRW